MTRSALLAGAAGAAAVLAAWDLIAAAGAAAASGALGRLLAPLQRAGDAGDVPTAAERRRLAAVAALTLLAAGWLVAGPLAAAALCAVGPAAAAGAVRERRRRWRRRLAAGAPEAARAIADALAGGHSVRGALAEAARSGVRGPAGHELRLVARSLALGEPTGEALERLRRRAAAPGYDTLVAAMLLQQDAGGDLAGLLRDLAGSLEATARAERDAHAATAQARFTGTLVAALPLGAAALAELAQPGALAALLASPVTATMLLGAALLQVSGLLVIRRLSRGPR